VWLSPLCLLARAFARSWCSPERSSKSPTPVAITAKGVDWFGPSEKDVVEFWKTAVQVQQHFNDLELRIRNFAVTALVGALGATAFALKEEYAIFLHGVRIQIAPGIPLAGMLGLWAFYFMDRHWYHRLLLGAVTHTVALEKALTPPPHSGLSINIGDYSPTRWRHFEFHSSEKLDLFYSAGLVLLASVFFVLAISDTSPPIPVNSPSKSVTAPRPQVICTPDSAQPTRSDPPNEKTH
jgi:hypothetical protein